jgi:hypothetical protein
MNEEEIIKEAEEIEKEIEREEFEREGIEQRNERGPLLWILALFLGLIVILMVIPHYAVRLDPVPKNIPEIDDVIPTNFEIEESSVSRREDYGKLVKPYDPVIKQTADRIISKSCKKTNSRICYAKAIFYFVRDKFDYANDPLAYEYVKSARESLITQIGDCDDASVLAANLLQAIGISTRFVFIPRHVFIQIRLPEAMDKYKQEDGWINLDLTCKSCEFGEIPRENWKYFED